MSRGVRLVADVDPGWQVSSASLADLPPNMPDWLTVNAVVETALPSGGRRFWLHLVETPKPVPIADGTELEVDDGR